MTTINRPNKDALNKALDIFRDAMRPFIIRNLSRVPGRRATDLINYSLQSRTNAPRNYNNLEDSIDINDFPLLIRDYWRDVFSSAFAPDRSVQNALWQIKEARNRAAHPSSRDIDPEFTRAHLFHIADMLGKINAPNEKRAVEDIRDRLFRPPGRPDKNTAEAKPTPSSGADRAPSQPRTRPSSALAPWRSVIQVNRDVADGSFQQAEFAADLQQVYDGRAENTQYGSPVSFFNHTYITPGIRTLLVNTLRRLDGNGGEPVIQTKTGFGGGKTHSLIALYHLVANTDALINPAARSEDSEQTAQDIRAIMEEAGLDPDEALEAKIAVLDCTSLSPTSSSKTENGDPLNTLWGEMAYQLGGQEAYEIVGEAARRGTAPAGQLDELFQRYGPCVILIDELVSYVRNATGAQDNIYTFIQNLTQAVRRNRRAALVVTLPEHAIEAGGDIGIEALGRLDNILGRIEATWEPLEVNEAFEVVRRRLFGNLTNETARDHACEAFMTMYNRSRADFPRGVSESRYLQRMKDCYPIHPEIFDRLYEDWSAIPQFQRTRGALRMMATCISRLYLSGDASPLIMPANLTLSDPALANEFTRLLGSNWTAVLSEVDSDNSRTDGIDKTMQRFADVGGAARRIARTIFFGSATGGSVRGIDIRQIHLGTAQPRHGVSIYNEALNRMTGNLYYLYSADGRYYFHAEENLNKVAADRAGTVSDREVYNEVHRVMKDAVGREPGVIIFPQKSGEVPDTDTVRLVILRPDKSLSNRASETDDATPAVLDILQNRDDASRVRKNTLLFLAPRKDQIRNLHRDVRKYLAWTSVQSGDRRVENLQGDRLTQVVDNVRQSEREVRSALVNAYRSAIAPLQTDPQDSSHFDANPSLIDSSDAGQIVRSAFDKFIEEEALVDTLSPSALADMLHQYIWNPDRDHISLDELWNIMTSNVYMHRLRNKNVLITCVERGIPEAKFGYAEAYLPNMAPEELYTHLRFNEPIEQQPSGIADPARGLIVNPEMARLVKEEQAKNRRTEDTLPSPTQTDIGVVEEDIPSTLHPSSPTQRAATRIIVNKTFRQDLSLDDMSQLRDEIIRNLNSDGGSVTVSVTISADKQEGFSENVTRSIRENSNQLGLDFEQI